MIDFACTSCNKRYSVSDAHAGRKMRCKQCQAVVTIPVVEIPVVILDDEPPAPAALAEPPAPVAAAAAVDAPPAIPAPDAASEAPRPKHGPFGGKRGPFPARKAGAPAAPAAAAATAGARPAFAARKPGARKLGARPEKPPVAEGNGGGEAAEPAAKKTSPLVLVAGVGVGVVLAALALWLFGVFDGGEADAPTAKPKSKPAATAKESSKAAVAANDGDEDGDEDEDANRDETKGEAATAGGGVAALPALDPLELVPGDVAVLASIDVAKLMTIDWIKEGLQSGMSGMDENTRKAFEDAGFDPARDLQRLVIALAAIPEETNPQDVPFAAFLQGKLDRKKITAALKDAQKISAEGEQVGRFEVHDVKDGEVSAGRAAFASENVAVLGHGETVLKALSLAEGGENVKSNAHFKAATSNFASRAAVWIAVELPVDLKQQVSQHLQQMIQQPVALDGAFLSLDAPPAGDPIKLSLAVQCPTPDDAKKLQGFVGPFLAMSRGKMPPPVQELLKGLKLEKPGGNAFRASLDIPRAFIDQAREQLPLLIPGGPPPELGGGEEGIPVPASADEEDPPAKDGDAPAMEEKEGDPSEEAPEPEAGGEEKMQETDEEPSEDAAEEPEPEPEVETESEK